MVYVKSLPELTTNPEEAAQVLYCPKCKTKSSANKSGYWHLKDDDKLTCSEGHKPFELILIETGKNYHVIN